MRILITAGPTREWLDDVRFISNPSSGRMGFACAAEARRRGHRVVLVCGPTPIRPPAGAIRVETTAQMLAAVRRRFAACDALIMTAAVADFAPVRRTPGKIKKGRGLRPLRLKPTPDILARLARRKGHRIFVGFAVESRDLRRNALRKMAQKRMDFIVVNRPSAMGAERADVTFLWPDGRRRILRRAPKPAIARRILDLLAARK
jgi:phosphopantothenoylcysteine decarboxylase/phosphopantothenate--cysteine ligase